MITRSSLRPHVCLQCQRNLTKRFTQSTTNADPDPSARSIDTSRSSSSAIQHEPPTEKPTFRTRRKPFINRKFKATSGTRVVGLDRTARLHGHRGRKLQENIEDLKLNSLGDAATAVVLRDSKYTFYTHVARLKDQEAEHVDIGKLLEQERGLVSQEEVRSSIDALRPQESQIPQTWEELNEYINVLAEGFTTTQLATYFESSKTKAIPGVILDDDNKYLTSDSHILGVTPWMPGVSQISESFEANPLRGYVVASQTTKQKLAIKIFRQCWQLEVPEISEGLGQFEIQLARQDIDLLSSSPDSPLFSIQNEYLAHEDEGIQVFVNRGVLRITTLNHKRSILLLLISQKLKTIHREAISLAELYPGHDLTNAAFLRWREKFYSQAVLQEIGQITNTEIRTLSKDVVLASTFTDPDKKPPSSRIDTVKRLLTTAVDIADQAQYSLESDNEKGGTSIQYPHTQGLNWWEKLRDWTRWTTPIAKESRGKTLIHKPKHQDAGQTKKRQIEVMRPKPTPTSSWWGEFNDSSALFGSVLHSSVGENRVLTNQSRPSNDIIQCFSTAIPNLSRLFQKTKIVEETDKQPVSVTPLKYISLRFVPDPYQPWWDGRSISKKECEGISYVPGVGSKALKHLPHVDMRFTVLEDNSVKLKDIIAITSSTKSDVMLPTNGVDLRFQNRTTRRLKHVKNLDNLRDFVDNSIFDLRRGKLVTPPSITLPIDSAMLNGEAQKFANFKSESQNIRYMFAGLDIRNSFSVSWNGWRLLYTSIEAGQAGGRRSELKLRPIKNGAVSTNNDFITAAYELAMEIGDSPALLEVSLESTAKKPTAKKLVNYELTNRGGNWVTPPKIFNDHESTKRWFINQSRDDENWDEDDAEGLDIGEVAEPYVTEDDSVNSGSSEQR